LAIKEEVMDDLDKYIYESLQDDDFRKEWEINEEHAQKIIDTPSIKLPITAEKKLEIDLAKKIIEKWKEGRQ
jgi:hypothetical protein